MIAEFDFIADLIAGTVAVTAREIQKISLTCTLDLVVCCNGLKDLETTCLVLQPPPPSVNYTLLTKLENVKPHHQDSDQNLAEGPFFKSRWCGLTFFRLCLQSVVYGSVKSKTQIL